MKGTFWSIRLGKTNRIIPNDREIDANYKIKSFSSLNESVTSYEKLNTNYHIMIFVLIDLSYDQITYLLQALI